jgi:hypothetical protein
MECEKCKKDVEQKEGLENWSSYRLCTNCSNDVMTFIVFNQVGKDQ